MVSGGGKVVSGGLTTLWNEVLLWPVTTVFPSSFCLMGHGAPSPFPEVLDIPAGPQGSGTCV